MIATQATLIHDLLPRCEKEDCDEPATMTSKHDDGSGSTILCDRCLATRIVKYKMHEDTLKEWFDMPHASLTRSLVDYVIDIEKHAPTQVH